MMFTRYFTKTLLKVSLERGNWSRVCPCNASPTLPLHSSAALSHQIGSERQMPSVYYYQNPFEWFKIKWQAYRLKKWDKEFDETEFTKGSIQAVSTVTGIIKDENLDDLQGLLTPFALSKLRRDILVLWNDDIVRNIGLQRSDIKLAVPTRIYLRTPVPRKKVCDIDMWYMAMKWRDLNALLIIDMVARFSRDFTSRDLKADWTISFFELRKYHVQTFEKRDY